MEPTGERSDDVDRRVHLTFGLEPQWSRPVNGRTTEVIPLPLVRSIMPQWSRPVNGRTTISQCHRILSMILPQWSRPVNGRTTAREI
jgi:hypothetical protein